ncbi:hypothetical protein FB479_110153 [Brevibacillus sp. AG162]|nr:hypothetical protein FB479_110153 [Brevibacillus sp. AG162]
MLQSIFITLIIVLWTFYEFNSAKKMFGLNNKKVIRLFIILLIVAVVLWYLMSK